MADHALIHTLKHLKGNARGCVITEPLWGIPFNLYSPFVSVYMLALGLNDASIGLLVSIGTAFQVFWTLISGALTDKFGRKRTTLIFDIISWSIPALIWAVAQNFTYFLVAAIINAVWRVTANSWGCLLVEDTEPHLLIDVYSWIYIAGLLSAFVSPLTSPLISRFGLVATMRGLYVLAFVMMTIKFIWLNAIVKETKQGIERMRETAHQGLFDVVRESPIVLKQILRTPATLYTGALMLILNVCFMVRGTFWSVLVSEELQIPQEHMALYPFARSVTMMLFFFFGMPWLQRQAQFSRMGERLLMVVGFITFFVSQVVLLGSPVGSYWVLLAATILEGVSIPLTSTMLDKLTVVTVDPKERARIMAWLNVAMLVAATPFGWLAGVLSGVDRRLPFVLVVVLFLLGGVVTLMASRRAQHDQAMAGA
ncbi:MAG: MFS transporter [Anaerolineae bacterium]|nr:MFS transporter [Anaerolineae bacterium]